MTSEQIDSEHWRLNFPEHEGAFIINILARLGRQYQEDPKRMSPALRAYWEGNITRGEASVKLTMPPICRYWISMSSGVVPGTEVLCLV